MPPRKSSKNTSNTTRKNVPKQPIAANPQAPPSAVLQALDRMEDDNLGDLVQSGLEEDSDSQAQQDKDSVDTEIGEEEEESGDDTPIAIPQKRPNKTATPKQKSFFFPYIYICSVGLLTELSI